MAQKLLRFQITDEASFLQDLADAFGDVADFMPRDEDGNRVLQSPVIVNGLGIRVDTVIHRITIRQTGNDRGLHADVLFSDMPGHEGAIETLGPRITDWWGQFTRQNHDTPQRVLDEFGVAVPQVRRSSGRGNAMVQPSVPKHRFAGV